MYLGARLTKKVINGHEYWCINILDYLKTAVDTIKKSLVETRWRVPGRKHVKTPMESGYTPELDESPELGAEDVRRFQEIIGMFRWSTENGRVDILHEISILSQCMAIPREGHMTQLLCVVAFIERNPKLTLCMDPDFPRIDFSMFIYYSDCCFLPFRNPISSNITL